MLNCATPGQLGNNVMLYLNVLFEIALYLYRCRFQMSSNTPCTGLWDPCTVLQGSVSPRGSGTTGVYDQRPTHPTLVQTGSLLYVHSYTYRNPIRQIFTYYFSKKFMINMAFIYKTSQILI